MGQEKKILHVVNISFVLPYFIGDQFDYFKERGYEMHVACSPSQHLNEFASYKGLRLLEINVLREIDVVEDIKALILLIKYIKRHRINIVIGHTPKGGLLAMLAAWICNIERRTYFRHGLLFETAVGFKRSILLTIERITGHLANKVVCVSPSVLEISVQSNLSRKSSNLLLHKGSCNGVDAAKKFNPNLVDLLELRALKLKYGIRDGDFVVGYIGRLVNDKGIPELIEAWRMVNKKITSSKLMLVGPFEERDKIKEEYKRLIDKDPSIIHIDLVKNTAPYYALMDVFILPSYREGLGTVNLEASAMEVPVITTRSTGCINSIEPGITGIYVDITPLSIKEGIEYYFSNIEIRRIHGKQGRQFILENFQQERIWEEVRKKVIE
ncbi:glycosyltransferase family 4 protein [Desertivirga arenae]|uniref:glycosyltransferase family 4 protein n=1 Tax=Desertivirga arenae TaxID=2810309 RepID=UPI001A9658FE|nr:glycosyltransferase family 4 protein [Pedobacter sp. SYSU D00823]